MDPVVVAKIVSVVIILLIALLAGFSPLKVRSFLLNNSKIPEEKTLLLLSSSLCFGAGILMGIVFLHLLPETRESMESLMENEFIQPTDYPITELVLMGGFFFIYIVEELVHMWVHHQHEHVEDRRHAHHELERVPSFTSPKQSRKRCESISSIAVLAGCTAVEEGCEECTTSPSLHRQNVVNVTEIKKQVPMQLGLGVNGVSPAGPPVTPPTIIESEMILEDSNHQQISMVRSVLVVLALSLHGAFEGLSLGLQSTTNDVWIMCAALATHKLCIAFSIGMELLEIGIRKTLYVLHMIVFSLASPLGAIIGGTLTQFVGNESAAGQISITFLQGLSGGTILYVTFCEVLERERTKSNGRSYKLIALLLGFALLASLECIEGG